MNKDSSKLAIHGVKVLGQDSLAVSVGYSGLGVSSRPLCPAAAEEDSLSTMVFAGRQVRSWEAAAHLGCGREPVLPGAHSVRVRGQYLRL